MGSCQCVPLKPFFLHAQPLILNVFFLLGSRYIHRFCLPENAVRFWVIFPLPPCTRFLCNYMYIILLAHGNQSQVNCLLGGICQLNFVGISVYCTVARSSNQIHRVDI